MTNQEREEKHYQRLTRGKIFNSEWEQFITIDVQTSKIRDVVPQKIIEWLDNYGIFSQKENCQKRHWVVKESKKAEVILIDIEHIRQYSLTFKLINYSEESLDQLYETCYSTYYKELEITKEHRNFRHMNFQENTAPQKKFKK